MPPLPLLKPACLLSSWKVMIGGERGVFLGNYLMILSVFP